jgi:site-specific recombinase XerD
MENSMKIYLKADAQPGVFQICGVKEQDLVLSNQFLETIGLRGLSPHTTRAYGFDLINVFRWLSEQKIQIQDLKQKDLFDYIAWQIKAKANPKSINRRLTTCRLFYRFCYDQPLPGGPGNNLPSPHYKGAGRESNLGLWQRKSPSRLQLRVKVPRKIVEPLNTNQVRLFLNHFHSYRDLSMVMAMLFCGLRSREVLSMNLDDVNLNTLEIRVCGKGNRERILPIPPALCRLLQNYLRFERPEFSSEKLFLVMQGKRRGEEIKASALRSLFRRRRSGSGIACANPHRMRHTFGANMAREGVHLSVLQRLMGHADGSTTLQYINLSMTDIAKEFQRATTKIQNRYQSN